MSDGMDAWDRGRTLFVPGSLIPDFRELVERGTTQWDAQRADMFRLRVRWHNGEPNAQGPGGPITQ